MFDAASRLLREQTPDPTREIPSEPSSNAPKWADASKAEKRPDAKLSLAETRRQTLIIESEDASTIEEPGEVSDAKAAWSYEDDKGGAHMVRGLHNVPAAYQSRARKLSDDAGRSINLYDAYTVTRNYKPLAVDPSSYFNPNRLDVTLFSAPWCGACRRTKQLLDSEDVPYNLRDIDDDPSARDEVRSILGKVTIPLTEINGTYISGYNRDAILRLVKGG